MPDLTLPLAFAWFAVSLLVVAFMRLTSIGESVCESAIQKEKSGE